MISLSILQTKRLILKKWEKSYSCALFKLAKNKKVAYPCGFLPHKSENDSKNIITNILQKPYSYAIFLKKEDILVGSISLQLKKVSNLKTKEAELGFWIGQEFWKKGYGKEASTKLIDFAFNILNINKIWCSTDYDNKKSINLQKSLGFKYIYSKILYMPIIKENRLCNIYFLTKNKFIKRLDITI